MRHYFLLLLFVGGTYISMAMEKNETDKKGKGRRDQVSRLHGEDGDFSSGSSFTEDIMHQLGRDGGSARELLTLSGPPHSRRRSLSTHPPHSHLATEQEERSWEQMRQALEDMQDQITALEAWRSSVGTTSEFCDQINRQISEIIESQRSSAEQHSTLETSLRNVQKQLQRHQQLLHSSLYPDATEGASDWDAPGSEEEGSSDGASANQTEVDSLLGGVRDVEDGSPNPRGWASRAQLQCIHHVRRLCTIKNWAFLTKVLIAGVIQFLLVFVAGPLPGGTESLQNPLVPMSEAPALTFFALDHLAKLGIGITFPKPSFGRLVIGALFLGGVIAGLFEFAKLIHKLDAVGPKDASYWDRAQSDSLIFVIFYLNVTSILMAFRLFMDYFAYWLRIGPWEEMGDEKEK